MPKPVYLSFTDKGIANRYEYKDFVEIKIHKELLQQLDLYKAILKHEMKHCEGIHSFKDFWIDIYDGIPKKGLHKFLWSTKGAKWQLSPIWYDNELIIDPSSLIIWTSLLIIAFYFLIKLGGLII